MQSADYSSYLEAVAATSLDSFKGDHRYRSVLEHVSEQQGRDYLALILGESHISLEVVAEFCALNDRVGGPIKYRLADGLIASPTSLRYIYHAHLILSHCRRLGLPAVDVAEVGGGYGGLCLAIRAFAPSYGVEISSYGIVDLAPVLQLQKRYFEAVGWPAAAEGFDAAGHGVELAATASATGKPLFLVSNYCYSELDPENRKRYREILFPSVAHGFLAWNFIPLEGGELGFEGVSSEPENPLTGRGNLYVRF